MPPRKAAGKNGGLVNPQDKAANNKSGSPELDKDDLDDDDDANLEEGNTRLSELLKTIKHLSGNWWEVDLAKILDEYIDIISKIEVTIDGGATTVDFSKASYVIQNMANAYSKKVDLLLQLVEKIRDDLRVYAVGDNQSTERNADGRPKRNRKNPQRLGLQATDFDMDFSREVGPATTKNIRRIDPQEARQTARSFPFIALPPWYLTNQNSSSVADGDALGGNKTPLQSASGDMLGYIEDFRVNRPFESSTGFVGYNFVEDDAQEHSVQFNPLILPTQDPNSQPDAVPLVQGQPEETDVSLPDQGCHLDDELPDPPDLGGDSDDEGINSVPPGRVLTERDGNIEKRSVKMRVSPPVPVKPQIDPWSRCDPYDAVSEERPAKPGKTTLLPDGLKAEKDRKPSLSSSINGVHSRVQNYIKAVMMAKQNQALSIKLQKIMLPEFAAESASNIAEAERLIKKLRKQSSMDIGFPGTQDLEDDGYLPDDFDDMHHEVPEGNDSFSQDDLPPAPTDMDQNNVFDILQRSCLNATLKEAETISYENLVQQRVAEYMAQAQEYLQRTDLAKRVAEWHEAVLPRLEASEKQRHFDIHEYGTMVLDCLSENIDKEWVHFGDIVRGQPGSEVARYFSATLQLANGLNLELRDDGAMGMDTLHCKFLTSERHHENMDGGEAFQQQKKKGKRKNP